MISNPAEIIENELKVLLNETKKKNSNIKEVNFETFGFFERFLKVNL